MKPPTPLFLATAVLTGVALGIPSAAWGQTQFTAAKEKSVILPVATGIVSLDLNEERLGLQFVADKNVTAPSTSTICGHLVPNIPDHRETTVGVGIAAKKGKRSLITAGKATPGIDIAVTRARFKEQPLTAPAVCGAGGFDEPGGYDALFVTASGEVVNRKIATAIASTSGGAQELTFADKDVGGKATVLLGWNHGFKHAAVLGLALDAGREWKSVGENDPVHSCTVKASGVSEKGDVARIEECDERYAGPLSDVWRGQLRLNFTRKILTPTDTTRPSVGVIGAATATARSTMRPGYSASAGLTLHPKDKPSNIFGAALLELSDISNSRGKSSTLWSMVGLTVVIGLPLK